MKGRFLFVLFGALLIIFFGLPAYAEAPGPAALSRDGGLDCVTYNDQGDATAKFRVFWVQLRDVTLDSMTFQTKDGNITLSRDYLWLCKQFSDEIEEKWYEDE